jgi:hypothetical protein
MLPVCTYLAKPEHAKLQTFSEGGAYEAVHPGQMNRAVAWADTALSILNHAAAARISNANGAPEGCLRTYWLNLHSNTGRFPMKARRPSELRRSLTVNPKRVEPAAVEPTARLPSVHSFSKSRFGRSTQGVHKGSLIHLKTNIPCCAVREYCSRYDAQAAAAVHAALCALQSARWHSREHYRTTWHRAHTLLASSYAHPARATHSGLSDGALPSASAIQYRPLRASKNTTRARLPLCSGSCCTTRGMRVPAGSWLAAP